ncbi:MAG: M43 family zinc metalloprotease [Polyangiales bacterium]
MDLDLFYVGGGMLRPERDGSVPVRLLRALRDAERVLAPSRIRFGEIRQHVIPGILRGRYAFVESGLDGDPGELQELFALGAGSGRGSLPIFLVRDISGALGIAGDIPGAWMHPGEITNGIAISVDAIFEPDPLTPTFGVVLAHETGHYLGLFHSTEIDGTVLDPIADTPECGPERDTDGDGLLFEAECEGAGGDNFMFWAAQDDVMTAGQGTVAGRALLLR